MEILNQFGFEPTLFIAQIVNFLILAFIFKKFLYKPLLKVINDRKRIIAKGLEDAAEAAKNLEQAEEKKDAITKKAVLEAEKLMNDTKVSAEELKEKILLDAKKEAEKIVAEAKVQADMQMESMEKTAKQASLDNSVAMLDKVLEDMFTKDEKEKILTKSMKVMRKYE